MSAANGCGGASAFSCLLYGLGIQYNHFIAGLSGLAPSSKTDVLVTFGTLPQAFADPALCARAPDYTGLYKNAEGVPEVEIWRVLDGKYLLFHFDEGYKFAIRTDGSEVFGSWPATSTAEDAGTYFLGPLMGLVLRMRGITVLHACAVAVGGKAVVLVGPSGAGKSSTAAAFAKLGYPVLSEDVVALTPTERGFDVQPGYPRIRLWPASVAALFGADDALPLITPSWHKRYLDLNGPGYHFMREAAPLGAIYMVDERRAATAFDSPSPREVLMGLISNTHASRMMNAIQRADEFDTLTRVVECVPVRRISARDDRARIAEVCEDIVEDLTAMS